MKPEKPKNILELWEIAQWFLLVVFFHVLLFVLIYGLTNSVATALLVWFLGSSTFFLLKFDHVEPMEMVKGVFLVVPFHIILVVLIFGLARLSSNIVIYGLAGFFLLQLIYIIPLCIWLQRQGKTTMMRGCIISALITALLNGACFILISR